MSQFGLRGLPGLKVGVRNDRSDRIGIGSFVSID